MKQIYILTKIIFPTLTIMALLSLSACAGFPFSKEKPPPPNPFHSNPFIDIPLPPEISINEKTLNVYTSDIGHLGILR
ncbi:MAG: hypothetical protein ACRCTY_10845, partial [Candidatus Adiutrix sp.]